MDFLIIYMLILFDHFLVSLFCVYSWYFAVNTIIHFSRWLYMFSELGGYFRQFLNIQLASQPSSQTVKLRTAAFSTQQLSLHSSFPHTASQLQPKQTGP
jgi:hypothetical protein